MSDLALALRQVGYENRVFWRNPPAAFFTFAFPLLFMAIFSVIFGRDAAAFYTPGIIVFGVVTATYTNLALTVTIARDEGILKRMRGTPLPLWAYLAGRIGHAIVIAILLVVAVAGFGAIAYGIEVPWEALPVLILVLAVSAAAFSALGLAMTGFIPSADAAPAIVNATILPLLFISNVFINMDGAPQWLNTVSRVLPVRHVADAMMALYREGAAAGVPWTELGVIAAWGAAGVVVALRFFTWEPRR
ncbi:MAG TPA: ABC transporter permease [Candidatus Limnocylindrales bacterium]|nr:ABC transporter permease [Candidatus Limnocylindrales bacterium]